MTSGRQSACARIGRDRSGASAVEFALVSPLLLLIAAFTLDFGSMLFTRFQLDQAVTASATYGLVNAAMVNESESPALAARMASIIGNGDAQASARVVLNNGPVAESNGGQVSASGTPANAQACYCPDLAGGTLAWGQPVACGTPCPTGAPAGRFITITARRPYTPLFADYGVLEAGDVVARAVVQAQ